MVLETLVQVVLVRVLTKTQDKAVSEALVVILVVMVMVHHFQQVV